MLKGKSCEEMGRSWGEPESRLRELRQMDEEVLLPGLLDCCWFSNLREKVYCFQSRLRRE